jgi:RNA polymerase sigma factor (sigma-70 family)
MECNTAKKTYESPYTSVLKHRRLIRHLASKHASSLVSVKDLEQEGLAAFLEAEKTFDAERETALWTYARPFVFGAMMRFATKEASEAARPCVDDAPEVEADQPAADVQVERAQALAKLSASMVALSPQERKIVRLHMDGQSFAEIAESLEMKKATVFDVYQGAIEKLRELVRS